ncbi:hypothetical protein BDY19DRAFT_886908 [Irpex rosettiformis]|uniref:Uncharacterized protein n=1 Tax=Irpex rosettiformis TaxID=378272 RepID=A0ACB8U8A0_9APHY|nr:hypothetical protein BDY19DRAFT_886908 [Irpex rosettiformis]
MDSVSPVRDQTQEDTPKETHLSFPEPSSSRRVTPPPVVQPRKLLKDRLYVGNLHPSVDEYVLLQVFSKYGRVSKLDFLFHKSGPLKGKPRGYAFVEFADTNDADKALASANDKLLRGRKLVVTHAQQAPLDASSSMATKSKRPWNDMNKPTTLSLLKSAEGRRTSATDDKIAKMEAKLRQLEHTSSSGIPLEAHPSLPAKPVAATLAAASVDSSRPTSRPKKTQTPLPSLPLAPPSSSTPSSSSASTILRQALTTGVPAPHKSKSSLTGVVLKKRKDA